MVLDIPEYIKPSMVTGNKGMGRKWHEVDVWTEGVGMVQIDLGSRK